MLQQLNEFRCAALGSEEANVFLAWNGAYEAKQWLRAVIGFTPCPRLTLTERKQKASTQDIGYIGHGVYFTQWPSYGENYAKHVDEASSMLERVQAVNQHSPSSSSSSSSSSANAATTTPQSTQMKPLLLSFVLMGRVYPVIEQPNVTSLHTNMFGHPIMEQYDSHYSLMTGANLNVMFPITDKDQQVGGDELCINNSCQVRQSTQANQHIQRLICLLVWLHCRYYHAIWCTHNRKAQQHHKAKSYFGSQQTAHKTSKSCTKFTNSIQQYVISNNNEMLHCSRAHCVVTNIHQ